MDRSEIVAQVLKDPHAPQGQLQDSLEVALYVALCLTPANLKDEKNRYLIASVVKDLGFNGECPLDFSRYLQDLVSSGALILAGGESSQYYIRAFDAKLVEGKVSQQNGESIIFDDNTAYKVIDAVRFITMRGDEVEAYLSPLHQKAYVKEIKKARDKVIGFITLNRAVREYLSFGYFSESERKDALSRLYELTVKDMPQFSFKVVGVDEELKLYSNDLVVAQIVNRTKDYVSVKVVEKIQSIDSIQDAIFKAMLTYDINLKFPSNVQRAAKRVNREVLETEIQGRVDLRDLPLVTIDGEDARDFDDAVYVKKGRTGYTLYVAIADVSYYVRPGTLLDKEALNRTTSVYFPYFVAPMLPVELSNGICSLNPNVDRLCMVCELGINRQGEIKAYKFYPAVMKSHGRLTYTEAYEMIFEGTTPQEEHQALIEDLKRLHELYLCLKKAREKRGAIDLEGDEVTFTFDGNLQVDGIVPQVRNDAHMLIEECMIAANIAAAKFVSEHGFETLYRVHAKPSDKKLEDLRNFLALSGFRYNLSDSPTPQEYAKISQLAKDREDAPLISMMLLRSMSKAVYSPNNIGHFGLALDFYAHFTSPIRRYPDLQIHRVIKYILEQEQTRHWGKIGSMRYSKEELTVLGDRCSDKEVAATQAEYDVDNALKCMYLQRRIGDVVDGMVTATASFGVFVNLIDFHIDGMIFIGDLEFLGNQELQPGDKLKVKIVSVDVATHKIGLFYEGRIKRRRGTKKAEGEALNSEIKKAPKAISNNLPTVAQKEELIRRNSLLGRKYDHLMEPSEELAAVLNQRAQKNDENFIKQRETQELKKASKKKKEVKEKPVETQVVDEASKSEVVENSLYPLQAFLELWDKKKGGNKSSQKPIEMTLGQQNLPKAQENGKELSKSQKKRLKKKQRRDKTRLSRLMQKDKQRKK